MTNGTLFRVSSDVLHIIISFLPLLDLRNIHQTATEFRSVVSSGWRFALFKQLCDGKVCVKKAELPLSDLEASCCITKGPWWRAGVAGKTVVG